MAIKPENEEIIENGKGHKRKKAGIFSFIMCLLIAFVIWCYAEAQAEKKAQENQKETIVITNNAVSESESAEA